MRGIVGGEGGVVRSWRGLCWVAMALSNMKHAVRDHGAAYGQQPCNADSLCKRDFSIVAVVVEGACWPVSWLTYFFGDSD
jgi:hypothetical protein